MSAGGVRLAVPVGERDRSRGPGDAPVTLVEYGDYDCPYTFKAHETVEEVLNRLKGELCFVFRVFPLTRIHVNAQAAAEAAEAAAAQDLFWPMHDRLLRARRNLSARALERYAGEVGLDVDRFRRETTSHAHSRGVREQLKGGLESGVRGTPTFFINGVLHEGPYGIDSLLGAIEEAGVRATSGSYPRRESRG